MKAIPCDTQMRTRLDEVDPDSLRPAYKAVFNQAEQEKILEKMVFLEGCILISNDGTGYFSSEKLHSPGCLEKKNSKTGQIIYHLQMLGSAIVHPDHKEVIPLPPEPSASRTAQLKTIANAMPHAAGFRNSGRTTLRSG